MKRMIVAAIAVAGMICAPGFAAPAVQQVGKVGPTSLTLQTTSSMALVRQQARVQLREGKNLLSFSWDEEKIDAASVRLRAEGLQIGQTERPAGTENTLRWTVTAPEAGERLIAVSYLLDGMEWSPDYRIRFAQGEAHVRVTGSVAVTNDSGLSLEDVEASIVLGRPASGSDGSERLSFQIPGLDSIAVGETVRVSFLPPMELSAELVHRIDSERATRVERFLVIQPPATGVLGREALPAGPAYLSIHRPEQPTHTLRTKLEYQPSEKFEIAIGPERDLMVKRTLLEQEKTELEFDRLRAVSGHDTVERYRIDVTSYLDREVELEIVETVLETWRLRTRALHVLEDGRAIIRLTVPPGDEASLEFTITKHSGTRIP